MDLFVRILSDYDAVNAARRLLYEVYISEMGWDFRSDSPTGFRIDKDDQNKPILCDTLTTHLFGLERTKEIAWSELPEQSNGTTL